MRSDFTPAEPPYEWRRDGWLAACSLTAALLIISALTAHAPGFDTFLRIFVFCMAVVRGLTGFRRGGAWLPLSAAVIAILFNPARPIGMSPIASTWCDLIAAAWFAVVGVWQLLRSWDPQRGWAIAALSVGALSVPALAALNAPNKDALTAPNLNQSVDENLAVTNGDTATAAAPPDANAAAVSSVQSTAAESLNAPAEAANRVTHSEREVSAETNVASKPSQMNGERASRPTEAVNEEPADDEAANNASDANQD